MSWEDMDEASLTVEETRGHGLEPRNAFCALNDLVEVNNNMAACQRVPPRIPATSWALKTDMVQRHVCRWAVAFETGSFL